MCALTGQSSDDLGWLSSPLRSSLTQCHQTVLHVPFQLDELDAGSAQLEGQVLGHISSRQTPYQRAIGVAGALAYGHQWCWSEQDVQAVPLLINPLWKCNLRDSEQSRMFCLWRLEFEHFVGSNALVIAPWSWSDQWNDTRQPESQSSGK